MGSLGDNEATASKLTWRGLSISSKMSRFELSKKKSSKYCHPLLPPIAAEKPTSRCSHTKLNQSRTTKRKKPKRRSRLLSSAGNEETINQPKITTKEAIAELKGAG